MEGREGKRIHRWMMIWMKGKADVKEGGWMGCRREKVMHG